MSNSVLYNKAIIYKALETMPREQLEALKSLFLNLSCISNDSFDTMSDEEYKECLSIVQNSSEDDWFDLDKID